MAQPSYDGEQSLAPVMEDGGLYSERNLIGFAIAERVKSWVSSSAKAVMESSTGTTFTYCDSAIADGGMATVIAKAAVSSIREAEKVSNSGPLEIHVVMGDQADNDFGPFFRQFQQQLGEGEEKVFASAIGRSFYKQCMPTGTVDLALHCGASHWLDNDSPLEGRSLQQKAAVDWTTLLTKRAHELRKGGRLILINDRKSDPDGQTEEDVAFNQFQSTIDLLLETVNDLVREGQLTEEEGKRMTYPAYSRTEAEQKAPFQDPESSVRQAGLALVSFHKIIVQCPSKSRFLDGEINASELGKELADSIRSWGYFLVYGILENSRSEQEKKDLADIVFCRLAQLYERKSKEVGLPYSLTVIVSEKK